MTRARPRSPRWVRITLLAVLTILLSAVVIVVWVLPDFVSRRAAIDALDRRTTPEAATPAAPKSELVRQHREKREAELALQVVLQRQSVLEAQQVRSWAGGDYEEALARLAEGDVAFADNDFATAVSAYRDVAALFAALEASKAERLVAALERGALALKAYGADSARKQFTIALAIDPRHAEAQRGLERAGTLDRVAELLASARKHEQDGEWALAEKHYTQARQLDPESEEAQQGEARVAATRKRLLFREAMSAVLTAMEDGKLPEAQHALDRARALNVEPAEVADVQRRLTRAVQAKKIGQHRTRAQRAEHEESWRDAIADYDAALTIDPRAQFALQGRQRAERYAELHAQLDTYLGAPDRLQSSEPRANASRLLQTAATLSEKGPKLLDKLNALERIVRTASTPVTVVLRSDNQTEISIDRVGRFGRFTESKIELLPGTYRVRGSRFGFRDVHLEWTVTAVQKLQTLEVRCKERI